MKNVRHTHIKGIALALGVMGIIFGSGTARAANPVGKVIVVAGTLTAAAPGQAKRVLKRRSPVFEKDTLSTSAKGYAQVRLKDGTLVTLRPDTVYRLDAYRYVKKELKTNRHIASLLKGTASTLTGAIKKSQPKNIVIKTKVAVIGLRGTEVTAGYVRRKPTDVEKKAIKVLVSGGSAEITNEAGKFFVGLGYENQNVLIGSGSSKPVGLEVSEATATAFNAEGLGEDSYLVANSLSESIQNAQLQLAEELLVDIATSIAIFSPPEFLEAQTNAFLKSLREGSWSTSLTALSLDIINNDSVVNFLRMGGQIPTTRGDFFVPPTNIASFPRFVAKGQYPALGALNIVGRATDDADGKPIFYFQFDEADPQPSGVSDVVVGSYIDTPTPPRRDINTIGDARVAVSGSITNLSGEPIHFGRWDTDTGFIFKFNSTRDFSDSDFGPLGFDGDSVTANFIQEWVTFIPSSLVSLRAVRGVRHYTKTALVFGGGHVTPPTGDRLLVSSWLPRIPITGLVSNFSLNYGTSGTGLATASGTIDIFTADGSQWRLDFDRTDGAQAGSNLFRGLQTNAGTLINSNTGGPLRASLLGNVFSAHSRICGPHCPAAGFAGTIIALRQILVPEGRPINNPEEGTLTAGFVLTTP